MEAEWPHEAIEEAIERVFELIAHGHAFTDCVHMVVAETGIDEDEFAPAAYSLLKDAWDGLNP